MNKILKKVLVITGAVLLLVGCTKNYKKLAYTTYNEYFNSKDGYTIIDHSNNYGLEVIRSVEAGNGTIQIMYTEYKDSKEADTYIKNAYGSNKNYKINKKDKYTIVKSTKGRYFKLYKVDNVIVYGTSQDKKDKKEINSILKDLGY